jgi:hypothetical protein
MKLVVPEAVVTVPLLTVAIARAIVTRQLAHGSYCVRATMVFRVYTVCAHAVVIVAVVRQQHH